MGVQLGGDGGRQHGVTQEFEALVVLGAEALVRERTLEQRRLDEAVAKALLQGVERSAHQALVIASGRGI